MNIHQLELFYHVVRHQGVSQAARALEKEQPTLSRQINDLEDGLGTRLYHRRPFRLTERGETLFRSIEPFFRDLAKLELKIKGRDSIRIGASAIVLKQHLPAVEKQARRKFPNLHLVLREANQPQLMRWLECGDIELAITLLPGEVPQKIFVERLLDLPLVLLVPQKSRLRSAHTLLNQAEIRENLICLTQDEIACLEFQEILKRREIEWRPSIEVGSLDLVEHYVLEGYGVGLGLRVPGNRVRPGLRMIDLPDFPTIPLGMLWRDNGNRILQVFRELSIIRARQIAAGPLP